MNRGMYKGILVTLVLFAIGLLCAVLVVSFVGGEEIAHALQEFSPVLLLPVGIFLFLEIIVSTFRWKYILNALGEKISLRALLPVWMAGNAFNYLTPIAIVGGEGIRVMMLKRRFDINYHRGSASVLLDQIFNGLSVWPMVVVGLFVFTQQLDLGDFNILIVVAFLFAIGLFSFLFLLLIQALRQKPFIKPLVQRFSLEHHKVSDFLVRMEEEVISFRSLGLRLFWKGFLLSYLRQGIILLRTMFILNALGQGLIFKDSLLSLSGVYVSYLVPVPLALGVQETSQATLFSILDWGAGLGFSFSMLYRAAELCIIFGGVMVLASSVALVTGTMVSRVSSANKEKIRKQTKKTER